MYAQALTLGLLAAATVIDAQGGGAVTFPASRSTRSESRVHSRFVKHFDAASSQQQRRNLVQRRDLSANSRLRSLPLKRQGPGPGPVGPGGESGSSGVSFSTEASVTTTTSALPADVTSTSAGEVVPLYDVSYGETYSIDLQIGGVNLTVVADSGSADLWVPSSSCTACKEAGMVITSLVADNSTGSCHADLTYGTGEAIGCSVNTTVTAGNKTLTSFPVVAVTDIDSDFAEEGTDISGIVGLATNNVSVYANETFPSALYSQGLTDSPTVSFYLARDNSTGSELTFGNATLSKYVNSSTSVTLPHSPLTSGPYSAPDLQGLYFVPMDSINVDGVQAYGNASVVLDTGTSVILVPDAALEQLIPAIYSVYADEQGNILTECDAQVESVTIGFGGMNWTINSTDLINEAVDEAGTICLTSFQPSGIDNLWIMGAPVIRNFFPTFNTYTGDVVLHPLNATTVAAA